MSGQKNTVPVTIGNGQAVSNVADLVDAIPVAVVVPSTWTTADLTFQTSDDGRAYHDVYDEGGSELTVKATAGAWLIIPDAYACGFGRYVKVRSGTAASPVNQAAAREVKIIVAR